MSILPCELQRAKIESRICPLPLAPHGTGRRKPETTRPRSYHCLIERKPGSTSDSGEDDRGLGKLKEGLTDVTENRGYKQT